MRWILSLFSFFFLDSFFLLLLLFPYLTPSPVNAAILLCQALALCHTDAIEILIPLLPTPLDRRSLPACCLPACSLGMPHARTRGFCAAYQSGAQPICTFQRHLIRPVLQSCMLSSFTMCASIPKKRHPASCLGVQKECLQLVLAVDSSIIP